jgi:hypothetical protein
MHLRACTKSPEGGNCGVCEKCVRTKFEFLVNGADSVPALGEPPTIESLAGLEVGNTSVDRFWQEILDRGSWERRPEMRTAIEAMLESGAELSDYSPRRARRSRLRLWWKYFRA